MNNSLVMVKPHAMDMYEKIIGDLESKIGNKGKRKDSAMIENVSKEMWREFYSANREKYSYWDELMAKDFDNKSAFVAIYEGERIQQIIRELIGPTQVLKNSKSTIRGIYGRKLIDEGRGIIKLDEGIEIYRNVIHATDGTVGEFQREFKVFEKYFK